MQVHLPGNSLAAADEWKQQDAPLTSQHRPWFGEISFWEVGPNQLHGDMVSFVSTGGRH